MNISINRIKLDNASYKFLLSINNEPICLFNSRVKINDAIQYLYGNDNIQFTDNHIKKLLDKYRVHKVSNEKKTGVIKKKALQKFI